MKLLDLFDCLPLLAVIETVTEFLEELFLLIQHVNLCQVVCVLQVKSILIQLFKSLLLLDDHAVLSAQLLLMDLSVFEPGFDS